MPNKINPFVDVWDGLWDMAEGNPELTKLVRTNNRIKFTDTIGPKKTITEGDLPELQLRPAGKEINLRQSSSSDKIIRSFTWSIATGEYDINKYYHRVSWELYRSMQSWDTVLCALVWPYDTTWKYVTNVQIASSEEGNAMVDENRGIIGWAEMLQMDVEMHFAISNLRV